MDFMLWQANDDIALIGKKLVFSLVVRLRLLETMPVVAIALDDYFMAGQVEVTGVPSNRVLLPKRNAHFGQETGNGVFYAGAFSVVMACGLMCKLAFDRTVNTLFCPARLQHHGLATIQAGNFDFSLTTFDRAVLLLLISARLHLEFLAASLANLFNLWLVLGIVGTVLGFEYVADKAKAGAVFLLVGNGTAHTKRLAASNALLLDVRQGFMRLCSSAAGVAAIFGTILRLRPCVAISKKRFSALLALAGNAIHGRAFFAAKRVFGALISVIVSKFLATGLTLAGHEKPPVGWLDVLAEGTTARQEAMTTISGCKPAVKRNVPSALVIIAHVCG